MGFMDKIKGMFGGAKGKAEDVAKEHGDKVVQGVDKATDVIDDKTGGKASGALGKVDETTAKAVDALDGDTPKPPAPPA